MPLGKGRTNNPGGRPKVTPALRALRERLRGGHEDAVGELLLRLRLSREATERLAEATQAVLCASAEAERARGTEDHGEAVARLEAALTALAEAKGAQLPTRAFVDLQELWWDRAWGKAAPVDADEALPADLRSLTAYEAARQLRDRVDRYQRALGELEARIVATDPAAAQEAMVEQMVAARAGEARH